MFMIQCLRWGRMWIILKSWKNGKNTAFIPWKIGEVFIKNNKPLHQQITLFIPEGK